MTEEFNAVNDDNPITKKVFDDENKSIYFYCKNLSHKNSTIVGFLTGGASNLKNSAHFSFKTSTGHITLNISGIYEIHFKEIFFIPLV